MNSKSSHADDPGIRNDNMCPEPDPNSDLRPRDGITSLELGCIENLLMADWRDLWGMPMTADEFLTIGGKAFEPLFQEPPIGPIPEYLAPHLSVHGCVAEYEAVFESLDRWKSVELSRWLKDRIGRNWCIEGRVYELQSGKEDAGSPEKFSLTLIEDRTCCGRASNKQK